MIVLCFLYFALIILFENEPNILPHISLFVHYHYFHLCNYLVHKTKSHPSSTVIGMRLNKEETLEMGIFQSSTDEEAMINFANSLLENLTLVMKETFELDIKGGNLDFKGNLNLDLKYSANSMLDFDFVFEQWNWLIKSEMIHSQPFLGNIDRIVNEATGFSLTEFTEITMKAYLNILTDTTNTQEWQDFEKNLPVYKEHLRAFIEPRLVEKGKNSITTNSADGKEIDVIRYEISFSMADYYEFYVKLLREAKKDAELKILTKNVLVKVLEQAMETKDYEIFDITTREIQTLLDHINNNWDMVWDEGFEDMLETFTDMEEMLVMSEMSAMSYVYLISIDSQNRIRQITTDMNLGFMSVSMVSTTEAFGRDVELKSIEQYGNAINVRRLINNPLMADEIGEEIATNFLANFSNSKAFIALLNDARENANMLPAEEREMMIQSINMGLMEIDNLLPMLLWQMGM